MATASSPTLQLGSTDGQWDDERIQRRKTSADNLAELPEALAKEMEARK